MLKSLPPQSVSDLWPGLEPPRSAARVGWQWIVFGVREYLALRTEQRRLLRAERQLERLDDRMLKDMGIGRSEIRRAVRDGRGL